MHKMSFLIDEGERAEFLTLCTRYNLTPSQALRSLCRLMVRAENDSQQVIHGLIACEQIGFPLPVYFGGASSKGGPL